MCVFKGHWGCKQNLLLSFIQSKWFYFSLQKDGKNATGFVQTDESHDEHQKWRVLIRQDVATNLTAASFKFHHLWLVHCCLARVSLVLSNDIVVWTVTIITSHRLLCRSYDANVAAAPSATPTLSLNCHFNWFFHCWLNWDSACMTMFVKWGLVASSRVLVADS